LANPQIDAAPQTVDGIYGNDDRLGNDQKIPETVREARYIQTDKQNPGGVRYAINIFADVE